jgi:hypothetical protein
MMPLEPPLRWATPGDAHALAELVDFASEGMAYYLWSKVAGPGGDAWAVGRERALRETGGFPIAMPSCSSRPAACAPPSSATP